MRVAVVQARVGFLERRFPITFLLDPEDDGELLSAGELVRGFDIPPQLAAFFEPAGETVSVRFPSTNRTVRSVMRQQSMWVKPSNAHHSWRLRSAPCFASWFTPSAIASSRWASFANNLRCQS